MESLERKHKNFMKAYKALQESLEVMKDQKMIPGPIHNVIVAGVIKHYELAYETGWKFLKVYLQTKVGVEIASPKNVFRACYQYQILPKHITDTLLQLVDERNLTVHIYDDQMAQRICDAIIEYFFVFDEIAKLK